MEKLRSECFKVKSMAFCLFVLDMVKPVTCPVVTDYMCQDGRCIESHLRCDHKADCANGSDETGCGERERRRRL